MRSNIYLPLPSTIRAWNTKVDEVQACPKIIRTDQVLLYRVALISYKNFCLLQSRNGSFHGQLSTFDQASSRLSGLVEISIGFDWFSPHGFGVELLLLLWSWLPGAYVD